MDSASTRYSDQRPADGKVRPFEAFAGALEEMALLVIIEQNFVVDFFHVSSVEQQEFPDLVSSVSPDSRKVGDLTYKKPVDPSKLMSKRLLEFMSDIYTFWPPEMQGMVDWAIKNDPMYVETWSRFHYMS
jgi:hypothetical protein